MSVVNTTRAVNIAPPQQAAGQVVNLLPDGSLVVECEGCGQLPADAGPRR
jgi:hypothetical protein